MHRAHVNDGSDAEAFVINDVGGPLGAETPLAYLKELELGSSRTLRFILAGLPTCLGINML